MSLTGVCSGYSSNRNGNIRCRRNGGDKEERNNNNGRQKNRRNESLSGRADELQQNETLGGVGGKSI